ncbi:probable aspartic proteinase GIP2 [Euphorbia lathyris]|uniref:probable aspartic proteinase GIP2 n=1 Tax=Euphorbia lathyris TaxID=212925 RepID=UPI0033133F67
MVSPINYNWFHFFFTALILLLSPYPISAKSKSFKPKGLILPISKDQSSNQYLTLIKQRTPLVPLKLTLDLGGLILWVDCEQDYVSSTYKPVHCNTPQCPSSYGCINNICGFLADNPYKGSVLVSAQLGFDVASIQSTNGSNPGPLVSLPKLMFTCSLTSMLQGLANGVTGMAGLGRHKLSLPSQFSSAFRFHKKFSMCLSSSQGVVIFGDEDVSKSLIYTQLILNPVSTATTSFASEPSSDYFIGVRSIKINGNNVPFNKTFLKIDEQGFGGTKISTVNPYTVMQTQIYKAFVRSFIKELAQVPRVSAVAPFGACFNSTYIGSTRVGLGVPRIDLVLQSKKVKWSIFGANSMVNVKEDVVCLGFVDGGVNPRTSIVIGGHQLEDNLLQFDLATAKLGFSSPLLIRQTSCANFNFTSNA